MKLYLILIFSLHHLSTAAFQLSFIKAVHSIVQSGLQLNHKSGVKNIGLL